MSHTAQSVQTSSISAEGKEKEKAREKKAGSIFRRTKETTYRSCSYAFKYDNTYLVNRLAARYPFDRIPIN